MQIENNGAVDEHRAQRDHPVARVTEEKRKELSGASVNQSHNHVHKESWVFRNLLRIKLTCRDILLAALTFSSITAFHPETERPQRASKQARKSVLFIFSGAEQSSSFLSSGALSFQQHFALD